MQVRPDVIPEMPPPRSARACEAARDDVVCVDANPDPPWLAAPTAPDTASLVAPVAAAGAALDAPARAAPVEPPPGEPEASILFAPVPWDGVADTDPSLCAAAKKWSATYPVLELHLAALDGILTRPLTPQEGKQAQAKPFFPRGDWQDNLAFGFNHHLRVAERHAASGSRGKAAGRRALAALGFTAYACGGAAVGIPVGVVDKIKQDKRKSVYAKERTEEGVREDIIGRTLGALSGDSFFHLTTALPVMTPPEREQTRNAHGAVVAALAKLRTELAVSSPRLAGSSRLRDALKATDALARQLGDALAAAA